MSIPDRPMLKPWYRIVQADGRLLLEYGHSLVTIEGMAAQRLLPSLLPLLDGRRTLEEITAYLGEPVEPAVRAGLEALVRAGAVTAGPPVAEELSRRVAETAQHLSSAADWRLGPSAAADRLTTSAVAVAGSGATAEEVARLLRLSGVGLVERLAHDEAETTETSHGLVVAVPSPAEQHLLDRLNEAALRFSFPWLPVVPFDGALAAIGPLVVPGESGCWRCVRLRRASVIGYADELPLLEALPAAGPAAPSHDAVVAGLTATLALRWLVLRDPALPGLLFALEPWPLPRLTSHKVYRVPRCPSCSELDGRAAPAPWSEVSAA